MKFLIHETGTINILDTNLLHKYYENAKEDR